MSIKWNGEGLPPVGVRCEHCPGGTTQTEWGVVTVAGIYENLVTGFTDYWLVKENGSSYTVGNPDRFRPLRTEEERKREEALKDLAEALGHAHGLFDLLAIYNAIQFGKVRHITLK